ncbi:transglutaminase-like cysteine peptidase [Marinobacterium rhizophilum]|uniref:Transglutaminase-like cysteine peptidase n=1 Tax=Marinobacterium rhizophilum TaxID=420402 RepID=A0ABY5HP38_9GAMM|nr:transglutaminase-like cysteine peptidase [Marinobacterium rhizophilum]
MYLVQSQRRHQQDTAGPRPALRTLLLLLLCLTVSASLVLMADNSSGVRLSQAAINELGQTYGEPARRRLASWQRLLADLAEADETTKLREVNRFFNQVRFLDDIVHWKKTDYWATPVEFLVSNGGDCEDFSIAKYYTLRELGVPIEKMSIAYVKALELNQAHMVLTYYPTPSAVPLVLDNLISDIKPASQRPDLLHVYSFNGDNLWLTKKGRRADLVGASDRLKPWVQLQSRINQQHDQ